MTNPSDQQLQEYLCKIREGKQVFDRSTWRPFKRTNERYERFSTTDFLLRELRHTVFYTPLHVSCTPLHSMEQ